MAATFLSESIRWRYLNFDGLALLVYPLFVGLAVVLGHPHWQALVMGTLAAVGLLAWLRGYRRYRCIVDTPTSRIGSAAQGYVEFNGTAGLFGPADGIGFAWTPPAVWLRYAVYRRSGDRWGLLERGQSASVFIIDDGTGRCLVDPEGAEVVTTRRFSEQHGDTLYRGEYIAPGDTLYALGEMRTEGGYIDPADTRSEVAALLATWKQDPEFLVTYFDRDGNGEVDIDEWQVAREAAHANIRERQRDSDLNPVRQRLESAGGWRPFLLSNLPERETGRRYRRWAVIHLAVFLVAGAVATWLAQRPPPPAPIETQALFISAPATVRLHLDGTRLELDRFFTESGSSLAWYRLQARLGKRILEVRYPDGNVRLHNLEFQLLDRQIMITVPADPDGRLVVR